MLNINKVMVTGRLTRDPETKYLPSGQALTNLGIAVDRRFMDKSGEWRSDTVFLDVETWGKLAERCAESMRKGQPVYVEGRLKMDTWERDGVKQSKIRVSAELVKAFDVPQRGAGSGDYGDSMPGEESGYSSSPRSGTSNSGYQQQSRAAADSMPSDGLEFGGGSGVKDDMPF